MKYQLKEGISIFNNILNPLSDKKAIYILIIVGIIVYANALFNRFVWDDIGQIVENTEAHSIRNIGQILSNHSFTYYRPFPIVIWSLIYTLFGPTPFWFHLFHILLHIVNSILIFILFKKYFQSVISLFLSLIFLVHPMNVESVAYISSLQTVLSLSFGLSVILLISKNIRPFYKYSLIFLMLVFSLLAKEVGVVFIIYAFFVILLKLDQGYGKKNYLLLGISSVLAIVFYVYLALLWGGGTNRLGTLSTQPIVHLSPFPIMHAPLAVKLLTFPKLLFYYLITFLFPKDLAISQQWLVQTININDFFLPLLVNGVFFAAMVAGFIFLIRRKKDLAVYIFFAIWLFLSWAFAFQIIPLTMTVADRWFYIPMVGLLGLLGIFLKFLIESRRSFRGSLIIIPIAVLALLSLRTIIRISNWRDAITLFSNDVKISTVSFELENSFANELLQLNRDTEAKLHLEKSIQLAPNFWENWNNLGVYYAKNNQPSKAIDAFSKAVDNNNDYYPGYANLAISYFRHKSLEESRDFATGVLRKYPQDPAFWELLAIVNYKLGNKEQALEQILNCHKFSNNPRCMQIYDLMEANKSLN